MSIRTISSTRQRRSMGLRPKTGIDLPGELQGYVASQTTLYDKNKAISAAEQSTWRLRSSSTTSKKHLVDVGEKYNMTFDEEKTEQMREAADGYGR